MLLVVEDYRDECISQESLDALGAYELDSLSASFGQPLMRAAMK